MRVIQLIGASLLCAVTTCEPRRSDTPIGTPTAQEHVTDDTYLGRRIAPTMSHEAAGWLIRESREAEENASRMIEELGLRNGDVACDFGAGNGYHTLMMAKLVAPKGNAIAADIQPEMLTMLEVRAKEAGIDNVQTVLSTETETKLRSQSCDLVLVADVYHELSNPPAVLRQLKDALTDRGVIALLEFRGEDDSVPIKPEHKMTKAQIRREFEGNGLRLVREFDGLPWQHLMFWGRAR